MKNGRKAAAATEGKDGRAARVGDGEDTRLDGHLHAASP